MVDLSPLITSLTTSIAPQNIIAILTLIIGVGMPFVLMWFGIRKLISIFKNAVSYGSFSIENYRDYKEQQRRWKQKQRDFY